MLLSATACTSLKMDVTQEESVLTDDGISVKQSALQRGKARIYVSEELAAAIEADEESFLRNNTAGITSIRRTFPDAGQFEERTRRCGLHLWYDVTFDAGTPLTKAGSSIKSLDGIGTVEFIPRLRRPKWQDVTWQHTTLAAYSAAKPATVPSVFNDPELKEQWHYYNRNLKSAYAVDGCDINIVPVWNNYKCGDENVIVAVVDGGIDYNHKDLAANMWHNPEQSGNKIYGYNFINDTYTIQAEDHGTHVAGIIAAVNNNGIGGCGVAGGNYEAGIPGVKLLSCQIFSQGSDESGDDIKAIKWAADHGAVICQNSWAYDDADYMPSSTKQAIDYFNEFAGTDMHGHQTGPMMGGLVVFASGNEHTDTKTYPPCYEGVIAVSALGADYRLASYSNYGDWLDIAAPGGEDDNFIFSTISKNNYAYYCGTSMAAPHVAGVAALIIANYGGEGFTREDLISILTGHTTDISGDNPSKYPGIGLVNAHAAIAANTSGPAFSISDCTLQPMGRKITANVSVAEDDGQQSWISSGRIYYSDRPFTSEEDIPYSTSYIRSTIDQSPFYMESGNLDYGTRYYAAVALTDEFGNLTPLTQITAIDTEADLPPVIVPQTPGDNFIVHSHESVVFRYDVSDPYLDEVTTEMESDDAGATTISVSGTLVEVNIRGYDSALGDHVFTLTATDVTGMQATLTVHYTVLANNPPEIVQPIPDLILDKKDSRSLDLQDFFKDADGETLSYTLSGDNLELLKLILDKSGTLVVTPVKYGIVDVTVTATDGLGGTVSQTFKVLSRDSSKLLEFYPNPVRDGKLYIRSGSVQTASLVFKNSAGSTVLSTTVTIEAFSPQCLDISAFTAGAYRLETTVGGSTETYTIVKL